MRFLVLSVLLLAFAAFVQSEAAEDNCFMESELHLVTPDEMEALGYGEAARVRLCVVSQCNAMCRRLGFRMGRCTSNAACVCSR